MRHQIFHHDASVFYVHKTPTAQGWDLKIRLRCSPEAPIERAAIRTLVDGEPYFAWGERLDAQTVGASGQWWEVSVSTRAKIFAYRWLIGLRGDEWLWLNGEGVWEHTVPDHADFRVQLDGSAPHEHLCSSVYQIFPDRFARSAQTEVRGLPEWSTGWLNPDPAQWNDDAAQTKLFGGDLWGIIDHLDYIQNLGFDTIYTTPFFEARSSHRYDAHSFEHVDADLGGDEALIALVDACHQREMRFLGDLTTNHTGVTHEWFRKAMADPDSVERGFYFFNEAGDYAKWLGVETLPKLNYNSAELRHRMFGPSGVVQKYLKPPFNMDGWRIDVANMTGRFGQSDLYESVASELRAAVHTAGEDKVLVAEHAHDFTLDIRGETFHGAMNYSGFTRPVWEWVTAMDERTPIFMGSPVPVRPQTGENFVDTTEDFSAQMTWNVRAASFNLVTSHDTARLMDIAGDSQRARVALALCYTLPGVPMILYGEEYGLASTGDFNCRVPIPWEDVEHQAIDNRELLRVLGGLRKSGSALPSGSLRWVQVSEDVVVFMREHQEQTILVCLSRCGDNPVAIDDEFFPGRAPDTVPLGALSLDNGKPVASLDQGIAVAVWNGVQ